MFRLVLNGYSYDYELNLQCNTTALHITQTLSILTYTNNKSYGII